MKLPGWVPQAMAASFHVLSNALFTAHPTILRFKETT
jgi:hypothetical protein